MKFPGLICMGRTRKHPTYFYLLVLHFTFTFLFSWRKPENLPNIYTIENFESYLLSSSYVRGWRGSDCQIKSFYFVYVFSTSSFAFYIHTFSVCHVRGSVKNSLEKK
uniref:Uncharacterized protein n=1 Tax=Cacopsylla melanoneura TaxID=428564 RepID=A0A8D9EFI5_9HEMI